MKIRRTIIPILAAEAVDSRDSDCDEREKQKPPKYVPGPHPVDSPGDVL
jgi:hypothetical protein